MKGNTGTHGNLNRDLNVKALLQYRNIPLKHISLYPAHLLLGRTLRDGIPQPKRTYQISPHWQVFIRKREKSMATEQLHSKEYHDRHSIKKSQ